MDTVVDMIKVLLDAGADVRANDDEALQWASNGGHAEVVRMLLNAGADVRTQSGQRESTSSARMS